MSDSSSPTRRVAIGAIGVATVAAAVGVTRALQSDAEPIGGGAVGPLSNSLQSGPSLEAAVQADLKRAEANPASVRTGLPADAHPDYPRGGPDTVFTRALNPSARRILYTWTTPEQIEALRAGGPVFHRKRSPRFGRSLFDQALRVEPGQPLAKHLRKDENASRRFGWPYPWATVMGWPGESYGDRLLRIELKPCAIPGLSVTATSTMRGSFGGQLIGAQVSSAGASVQMDKVGAVFHTHRSASPAVGFEGTNSYTPGGTTFREYVLFSEAHVARISHGDAACKAAIEADMRCLARWIDAPPWTAPFTVDAAAAWPIRVDGPRSAYRANLALFNDAYQPRPDALRAIHATLTKALAAQGPVWSRG